MRHALSRLLRVGSVALVAALPNLAEAAACAAASPERTSVLLELYTSEGCNSCPPADRWLSTLAAVGAMDGRVVPLALHVDYWDYIGWKDPYAKAAFAERQRQQAAHAGSRTVYTPQFFLQGKPYRPPGSAAEFVDMVDVVYRRAPRADIAFNLLPADNGRLNVKLSARLRDSPGNDPVGLFVVLYESDLSSKVKAGENQGATLRHDFVVRDWIGPKAIPASGSSEETATLSLAPGRPARNYGVAAFVQNLRTQEVLQAVAREVCG